MAFELRDGEIGNITHDDSETYSIHTETTINAPAEKVWAVLTDFDKLEEWCSSFIKFEGEFRKDGPAKVTFKLGVGNLTQVFDHPLIHFEEGRMFGWSAPLPYMHMHDNHKYIVEPLGDNKTQFTQTDQLIGSGARWIGGMMSKQMMQQYVVFNRELKARVESMT